jgi:hypothetical protein
MINHVWSVLCRKSIIDNETNNISLIDVLEQIQVNTVTQQKTLKPVRVPLEYEIVSLWSKDKSPKKASADIQVSLINSDGQIIKEFSHQLEIPLKTKRMRSRTRIAGIELSKSGKYQFAVKVKQQGQKNFKTIALLPIDVTIKAIN